MASEMLQQILDAEEKCNSEIEKAQLSADDIINSARAQTEKNAERIINEATLKANNITEKALSDSIIAESKAVSDSENEVTALKTSANLNHSKAVDCVINSIL